MSQKKQKNARKSHLNDFHRDESGSYAYQGAHYRRETSLTPVLIFSLSALTATVLAGFLPFEPILNTFYVILPFLGEIICAGFLVWFVGRAASHREVLREYVYRKTILRIVPFCTALCVFGLITLCTAAVFLLLHGVRDVLLTLLFVVCTLAAIACALCAASYAKKITWIRVEKAACSLLDD